MMMVGEGEGAAPEGMHHVNQRDVGTLPPGSSVFPIYSEFFGVASISDTF